MTEMGIRTQDIRMVRANLNKICHLCNSLPRHRDSPVVGAVVDHEELKIRSKPVFEQESENVVLNRIAVLAQG